MPHRVNRPMFISGKESHSVDFSNVQIAHKFGKVTLNGNVE